MLRAIILLYAICSTSTFAATPSAGDLFKQGADAYSAGGFEQAATNFWEAASAEPAAGTLHNLGNAEWQRGRTGEALYAWERAQWLDPFSRNTRANLRAARKTALLEAPELSWYETCSTWLPANLWSWLACLSFWLAVALVMLPAIFRWRKADWHQGVAAAGFAIFLLTIPALAGVQTRSKIGIVLTKDTPLRLTPTENLAEKPILLRAGDAARVERERGEYLYIRTGSDNAGWVQRAQLGLIAGS